MSQRDLVAELRAAHVEAPPEVRERVRLIAAAAPAPPRRITWRRALVVVVPVAAAIAATIVFTRPAKHQQTVSTSRRTRRAPGSTPRAPARRRDNGAEGIRRPVADEPRPELRRDALAPRRARRRRLRRRQARATDRDVVRRLLVVGARRDARQPRRRRPEAEDPAHRASRRRWRSWRSSGRSPTRTCRPSTRPRCSTTPTARSPACRSSSRRSAPSRRATRTTGGSPRSSRGSRTLQRGEATTRRNAHYATVHLHLETPLVTVAQKHEHGPLHGVGVALTWLGIGAVYALAIGVPVAVLLAARVARRPRRAAGAERTRCSRSRTRAARRRGRSEHRRGARRTRD